MKLFSSNLYQTRTLFFGEGDSFTAISRHISRAELLRKLKLAALLYDHTILAAAYFWQSDAMFSTLPYVETLISTGAILPAIRGPMVTRDVKDYYEKRRAETEELSHSPIALIPALASEIARPQHLIVANDLDRIGSLIYLDVGSVEQTYRRLFLMDALDERNPNSLHSAVVLNLDSKDVPGLLDYLLVLSERPYFSRGLLASNIMELSLPENVKKALIRRASDLYLAANADVFRADLLASLRTTAIDSHDRTRGLGPLVRSNVDLFLRFLQLCGISLQTVDALSGEELVVIRNSDEFAKFRNVYYSLVERAIADERAAVDELWERLATHRRADILKRKLLMVLGHLNAASSLLFAGALGAVIQQPTPLSQSILVASGVTSGIGYVLQRVQVLRDSPTVEFIDFMARREYRQRLNRFLSLS